MRVLVGTGLRGLVGNGLRSAAVRPFAAAMAQSVEEATGMTSVVGYHDKVSVMHYAAVSQAQTR